MNSHLSSVPSLLWPSRHRHYRIDLVCCRNASSCISSKSRPTAWYHSHIADASTSFSFHNDDLSFQKFRHPCSGHLLSIFYIFLLPFKYSIDTCSFDKPAMTGLYSFPIVLTTTNSAKMVDVRGLHFFEGEIN